MGTRNERLRAMLDHSVQIHDGFTQTSADGASLAFDAKCGNPKVRGKDAIRYVKLGDLIPE